MCAAHAGATMSACPPPRHRRQPRGAAARYWRHGLPSDQHRVRRPGRRARGAPGGARRGRGRAGRRSRSWRASPGVGKTRLLAELERAARADGVRVIGGDCVELGEGELPYAPIVSALRPLARAGDAAFARSPPAARAALAQILPGLGRARRRAPTTRRPRRRACSTRCWSCSSARGRGRAAADDRGPALGRPLDARVPRLSRRVAVPRARARGHHLPAGRAAPPPSAAPAARRARARRPRPPRRAAAAHARGAGRAARRHPRRGAARRTCWTACSRARRATRCSPRSCWRPGRTAAARSRRRCATR